MRQKPLLPLVKWPRLVPGWGAWAWQPVMPIWRAGPLGRKGRARKALLQDRLWGVLGAAGGIGRSPSHPSTCPAEGRSRNHGHNVCSTWGDFHYKTFDGDVFRFPGLCDYNFASDCRDSYKEFAVHLKRTAGRGGGPPQLEYILLTVKDDTVYLTRQLAVVNGAM